MEIEKSRLQLQPLSFETVEAVAALEQICFSEPWSLDSLAEELSNPLAVFYVATIDDTVLGYVGMHHIIDQGYITNIAVAPAWREQGIGSFLMQALLSYGEEHDLQAVTLEVRASNHRAIAFYEKFDFQPVGRRKGYYKNPVEDALLYTREF